MNLTKVELAWIIGISCTVIFIISPAVFFYFGYTAGKRKSKKHQKIEQLLRELAEGTDGARVNIQYHPTEKKLHPTKGPGVSTFLVKVFNEDGSTSDMWVVTHVQKFIGLNVFDYPNGSYQVWKDRSPKHFMLTPWQRPLQPPKRKKLSMDAR